VTWEKNPLLTCLDKYVFKTKKTEINAFGRKEKNLFVKEKVTTF